MDTKLEVSAVYRLKHTMISLALFCLGWLSFTSQAAAQDQVLGTWRWDNSQKNFTLLPDGTAVQRGRTGRWTHLGPGSSSPIQINWDQGKFIDTLTLQNNGVELLGQNQVNFRLRATRVGPPPVAVYPAPAPMPATTFTAPPPTAAAPTVPAPAATNPRSCVDRFSEQVPKVAEWTLAPLEIPVPDTVRAIVVEMGASLRDEAARSPQASPNAYQAGVSLCQLLAGELNERAALLRKNAQLNNNGGLSEAWKKMWNDRVFVVGPMVEKSYTQFQETVRVSPKPIVGIAVDRSSSFEVPPLSAPAPPAANRRAQERQPPETASTSTSVQGSKNGLQMGNGGLERGAYDKHHIWTWRYWNYWRTY